MRRYPTRFFVDEYNNSSLRNLEYRAQVEDGVFMKRPGINDIDILDTW